MGHFVSSPREREKIDRRDSRRDEREGQGRKRNRNESEETEEIKHHLPTLTCYKDSRPCPTISQYQLDASGDKRYMTPSHHPTTHFNVSGQILTALVSTISNSQIFLLKKCEMQKLPTFFRQNY